MAIGKPAKCLCGCGQTVVRKTAKYIRGHFSRVNHPMEGKHPSEKSRKKMSESHIGLQAGVKHPMYGKRGISNPNYGRHHSEGSKIKMSEPKKGANNPAKRPEVRKKISEARKGKIPWNTGLTKEDERVRRSCFNSGNFKKGIRISKETEFKKGCTTWNKGLTEEKSHSWKGGISFEPYCPKFNEKLKESVRNRDKRTCQLCNKKENGRKLDVHHIHYDKENCYPDLISLCVKCNAKVNHNRNYYEQLFMNKLNERGILFWMKNQTNDGVVESV